MGPSVAAAGEVSQQPSPPCPHAAGGHAFLLGVEELGTTLHLHLTGQFDLACIGRVEAALERVSPKHTRQVVFDLSELDYLDSAGLHTILRANERGTQRCV